MSYHVTILRTKEGTRIPISRGEIESVIASRKDLQAKPGRDGELYITPLAADHPGPTLIWEGGEIWSRNPDDATLALMLELAAAMGARVRGDELETYRTVDETYQHPDDRAEIEAAQREARENVRRTRRRQWALNAAIFGAFVLFAFIVAYFSKR